MRSRNRLVVMLLCVVVATVSLGFRSRNHAEAATRPQVVQAPAAKGGDAAADGAAGAAASAEPESVYGPSFAYIAWNLFLEAMAPANDGLTFEGWTEQCQLSPRMAGCPSAASVALDVKAARGGKVRLLHGSALTREKQMDGTDCGTMTHTAIAGYPAPTNLTPGAVFCEEVFVSPAEASFVKGNLATLVDQQSYGSARSGAINFPGTEQNESRLDLDSLEVKVDWVPASSFRPTFACPDTTNSLYTETINGTCYALAAVHITSKVMPNWLWATFEPNNSITNPNRCDPKLYGPCFDPYGTTTSQPYAKGQTAQQSPVLRQAMADTHMHPALRNYFLTGVQTQFVDNNGKPLALGNSFVEFNQGVPPGKSSCITCHQYAAFDGKQVAEGVAENNFGKPPHGWPSTGYACNQNQNGNCLPGTPGYTTQDFSWMLGLMPYNEGTGKAAAAAMPTQTAQSRSGSSVHTATP